MDEWGLECPIKEQLQAILQDYPGGQLLAEALQNSEDSGARSFALVLDERDHNNLHTRLGGPAFVLVDDGRGFGDREWRSLKKLNKSEKRECVPCRSNAW